MQNDLDWNDLRYFLAAARTGGLTDARRRLGVSASTVSRRIDALEASLDRRLFRRHRDGYSLTPAGARLVADAEQAEARILSLQRNAGVAADEASGVVRVATPELLANEVIVPRLGAFYDAHPRISLELLSDVRPVSLARDEADVVLRGVRPTHGAYTQRRIAPVAIGLFAARDYLARHGTPRGAADLAGHRLITWDRELAYLEMARWLAEVAGDAPVALRTTTFAAQLVACRAGCGLAVLPVMVGVRHGLLRVLSDLPPLVMDLWLVVRADLRRTHHVGVVCDFLAAVFAEADA